jgi:hypothetical protein
MTCSDTTAIAEIVGMLINGALGLILVGFLGILVYGFYRITRQMLS